MSLLAQCPACVQFHANFAQSSRLQQIRTYLAAVMNSFLASHLDLFSLELKVRTHSSKVPFFFFCSGNIRWRYHSILRINMLVPIPCEDQERYKQQELCSSAMHCSELGISLLAPFFELSPAFAGGEMPKRKDFMKIAEIIFH